MIENLKTFQSSPNLVILNSVMAGWILKVLLLSQGERGSFQLFLSSRSVPQNGYLSSGAGGGGGGGAGGWRLGFCRGREEAAKRPFCMWRCLVGTKDVRA